MTPEKTWATVLFADVAGFSSSLLRSGPDTVAELMACRQLFAEALDSSRGLLVDMAGDSVLTWFKNPQNALGYGIKVFKAISERGGSSSRKMQLRYRAGIDSGEILVSGREIFGEPVIESARICGLSNPGEISVSKADRERLGGLYPDDMWSERSSFIKEHEGIYTAYAFDPTAGPERSMVQPETGGTAKRGISCLVLIAKPPAGAPGETDRIAERLGYAVAARLSADKIVPHIELADGNSHREESRPRRNSIEYVIQCSCTARPSGYRLQILVIFAASSAVVGSFSRQYVDGGETEAIGELMAIAAVDCITRHQGGELLSMPTAPKPAFRYLCGALQNLKMTTPEATRLAIFQLRRALELDPNNARALGTLGRAYSIAWRFDWDSGVVDPLRLSYELSEKARLADSADFRCLSDFGFCAMWAGETRLSADAYANASHLVESDPDIKADYAMALSAVGEKSQALGLLQESLQQMPFSPDNRLWSLADILFSARQYEESAMVLSRMSNPVQASRLQAACAVRLRRDPQPFVQEILRVQPSFSVKRWAAVQPPVAGAEVEDFIDALLEAGLPP